jgi:hypothetical protein
MKNNNLFFYFTQIQILGIITLCTRKCLIIITNPTIYIKTFLTIITSSFIGVIWTWLKALLKYKKKKN